MKIVIVLITLSIIVGEVSAQTCTANPGGGDWNSAATWDCGIVPDGTITNVVIPAGITVTTPDFTTVNYDGQVSVYGTLSIGFIGQLNMAAGSSVDVFTGGTIDSSVGFITVDGNTTWITGATPVVGPATVDENGDGPLPITLIFFNANVEMENVHLSWATASEENFDYFSVERSFDGVNFQEVEKIQGVGDSFNRNDYEFTDVFPFKGISYYRLRSIDFDGYTEIFDHVIVNVEGVKFQASVFPNPVSSGVVNVQLNFSLEEEAQVLFYNNIGLIKLELSVNSWLDRLDISSLAPGSYLVKIRTKNGVFVNRLLIK